jgi:hypothetical protein
VSDQVRVVWASHLEKFLKVINRLSRLALEITLGGSGVFLIGVTHLLAVVAIVVTASSNCDALGRRFGPFLLPLELLLEPLLAALGGAPLATIGDRLPVALDYLFTRGVPGGNVKQLICGLWLITAEFMH